MVIHQRKFTTSFSQQFSFSTLTFLLFLSAALGNEREVETAWAQLLHFDYSLIRQDYVPAVFNSEFYLAKGAPTLSGELQVSLQEFARPVLGDEDVENHPICRFPARALFLKKYYGLQLAVEWEKCRALWQFKNKIDLDSVAVVFSSYYIDNASSAFGHTLLRLKRRNGEGQDLLDYGVNYAAAMTTDNPVLYGIYGIFGGFQGNFSMTPYFFKIREYNDMESRDLWEYQINLNRDELDFLVAHLWELDKARFVYYYLRQNCAYKILQLLDVVRPSLKLVDKLGVIVIPLDTVQTLFEVPGLVSKVTLRPSQQHKLKARLNHLKLSQKDSVLALLQKLRQMNLSQAELLSTLSGQSPTEQGESLDTLIDAADYLFPNQLLLGKGQDVKKIESLKMILLTERSQLSQVDYRPPLLDTVVSPHKGLPSRRWLVGGSDHKVHGTGINLAYRFSLQDSLELADGHAPNTELEMGHFFFRYLTLNRRFYVHDARMVSVVARRPWNAIEKAWSWMMRFGAKDAIDTNSIELAPYLTFGAGPTWSMNDGKLIFSTFLYLEESYSSKYERHSGRSDLGLRPSFIFRLTPRLIAQLEWSRARILTTQQKWFKDSNISLQWTINQRFSLQAIYHYQGTQQGELNLLGYL